jgi:hypothetical protein
VYYVSTYSNLFQRIPAYSKGNVFYTGWSIYYHRPHDEAIALLTAIPANIRYVDLGNDFFSQMSYLEAKRYLAAIPATVTHISYQDDINKQPIFVSKDQVIEKINAFIDYDFYFKCFGAFALIAGSALVLLGAVCLMPVVTEIGINTTLLGGVVISCMFFKGFIKGEQVVTTSENGNDTHGKTFFDSAFWDRSPFTP